MARKKSKKKHKKQVKKSQQAVSQKAAKKTTKSKPKAKTQAIATPKLKAVEQTTAATHKKTKGVPLIIILMVIILIGVVLFLFGQVQVVKDNAANTGQNDLPKVQEAPGDSLQPTIPGNTNPQQAAPSTQGSTGDTQNLQPSSADQTAPTQ